MCGVQLNTHVYFPQKNINKTKKYLLKIEYLTRYIRGWVRIESTKKAQVRACANNNILQGEYTMKQTEKQVVFYSAKKDGFLESYKNKGSLAFTAIFTDRLWEALQLPIEFYEKQKTKTDKLAEAFGCEVLIVEAEYNVTKLDGSDFERPEREESMKDDIKTLLEIFAK